MNRKERRKLEKKNVIGKFDPETQGRVKFSIELPPGLLRDDGKSSRSGQFTADNEVDLARGMFVKLLESFGFINQQQAVIGLFASVVNPFPKGMRGALAYAIINGTGLQIVEDQVEVCSFCEAEKLMTLNMDEAIDVIEESDDKCQHVRTGSEGTGVCGGLSEEDIHDPSRSGGSYYRHSFKESNPPMNDVTKHVENCEARPLEDEADRTVTEPQWKEITAVIVLTPVMYEPLQPKEEEGVKVVEGEAEAAAAAAEQHVEAQQATEPVDDETDHYPEPVNINIARKERPDSKDALIDDKE